MSRISVLVGSAVLALLTAMSQHGLGGCEGGKVTDPQILRNTIVRLAVFGLFMEHLR